MKNLLFAISLLLLLFTSCKTKQYTPATYEKEQLTFGNGGGFTGASVEYTLLSNGQLFKLEGENQKQIANIDKRMTKQVFENYAVLKMDRKIINDPGNMYYFIKRKTSDTYHKSVWGNKPVDRSMKIYFANLMQIVKTAKKFKPKEVKEIK